ncbi:ATP-binding response regulator [Desulfogranum japonicum]|uniref:ATP-binding response regulator n=1 Tax=Desulfogranum japonicum TaxID=231447 RepID=UPI000428B3A7|nr:response regulator [Desulfogranum japonicum]
MSGKYTILVVDDDLKNIQVGVNFLRKNQDYHLVFATSGEQALERVEKTAFDLILLDIIMPAMDGYEVCRRLKANDATKHIPIIFLTAKHEQDSLMKGFELGGADYITKPFHAAELNARVRTHLELHRYYQTEIAKLQQLMIYAQEAENIKFITSSVVHECNNFMTAIPCNIQLLQKELEMKDISVSSGKDTFDVILTAVSRVSEFLNHLSVYSKHSAPLSEIVEMEEVIADLRKIYKGHVRHNISLVIRNTCQPARVIADKLHVEQVLLNLLINAQHAILERPSGTPERGLIHLSIDTCDRGAHQRLHGNTRYLKISVKDNGVGMSAAVVEKIFEPYFSTRKDSGGTGLGLAVSEKIVHSHNGVIEVSSVPGKGTVFDVYLPQYIE